MSRHKRFWAGGVSCVLLLILGGCHNVTSVLSSNMESKSAYMHSQFGIPGLYTTAVGMRAQDVDCKSVNDFLDKTLSYDHRWRWRHQDNRLQREEKDRDWGWLPPPWLFTEAGEVNEVKDVAEVRRGGIFARYRGTGNY